jgi:hypothetical protein
LNALPRSSDLQVSVPEAASQPACVLGQSKQASDARNIAAGVSAITGGILTIIDTVRAIPATTRTADARTWGPFNDDQHPGVMIQVTMAKTSDSPPQFNFALQERRGTSGPFTTVISAQLVGATAQKGSGKLTLDWDAINALGINKATDPKAGQWSITYDFTSDPHTVDWVVPATTETGGSTLTDLTVAAFADGQLRLDASYTDNSTGLAVTETVKLLPSGAGRADYKLSKGIANDTLAQCWDPNYCLVWFYDISGWTRPPCTSAFCEFGDQAQCPSGLH